MKNNKGFTVIEGLLIFVIVSMIGGTGWYVFHAKKQTNSVYTTASNTSSSSAKSSGAQTITEKIISDKAAPSPNTTSATGGSSSNSYSSGNTSSGSSSSSSNGLVNYKSAYEGISFQYPSTWSFKDWDGNSTSSDGITLTSPNQDVLVSFGAPVSPPTVACGASGATEPMVINEVQRLYNNSKQTTYLMKYSETLDSGADKGKVYKGMGITDWDGQTPPTSGTVNKCSFMPQFASKQSGSAWFYISSSSESYLSLSYTGFLDVQNVQDGETIMLSATYN